MIEVEVDNGVFLEINLPGNLTKREEQVIALRFAGKSKGSISIILGTSINTVNAQTKTGFEKLGVTGSDNPLAILQTISFLKGWARFAAIALMVFSMFPTPRLKTQTKTRQGSQMASGRKNDDLLPNQCFA